MAGRPTPRKTTAKRISVEGLAGQRGVNAIERIVLDMGCRWTPSGPNETGIDGYIELYDPNSHEPLSLTLGVQSKVVADMGRDLRDKYDYWCRRADVEYWLNGNTPVILVLSDGSPSGAFWVSIQDYFRHWKPDTPAHVVLDKSKDRFNRDSFASLVSIAAPKPGLYLAPSIREEPLYSNLLTLSSIPTTIYLAGTECRTPYEVRSSLRAAGGDPHGTWILWEKKVLSFQDLASASWSSTCDSGTLEQFRSDEWARSDEQKVQKLFVQLLNQTLRDQISSDVRFWSDQGCYAMAGPPRKVSYRSLRRQSKIAVVSRFSRVGSEGQRFEWFRHLAFKGQFRSFDKEWYLEITPTYRFTVDGYTLDRFHEERLKGIKRLEGNRAVLSCILFWADFLRPKRGLFHTSEVALQFGELRSVPCQVGIVDRAWLSADPGAAPDPKLMEELFIPGLEDGDDQ